MNKAAMLDIKEEYNLQDSKVNHVKVYPEDNISEYSSYWDPCGTDYSDVMNVERRYLLNR